MIKAALLSVSDAVILHPSDTTCWNFSSNELPNHEFVAQPRIWDFYKKKENRPHFPLRSFTEPCTLHGSSRHSLPPVSLSISTCLFCKKCCLYKCISCRMLPFKKVFSKLQQQRNLLLPVLNLTTDQHHFWMFFKTYPLFIVFETRMLLRFFKVSFNLIFCDY